MSIFGKIERHAGLFGRMADTLRVDLAGAAGTGPMGDAALRSAVVNCLGCDQTDACQNWLDAHAGGAVETPGYCRNKAMLDRLAGV